MGQKQYRTQEQFDDMMESIYNGNRRQAGKIGCMWWRHAVDLVKKYNEEIENGYDPVREATDLVYLMESIQEARYQQVF